MLRFFTGRLRALNNWSQKLAQAFIAEFGERELERVSSLKLGVPPDGLFPPLPRTVRVEQSSITTELCRCPAGEGRG